MLGRESYESFKILNIFFYDKYSGFFACNHHRAPLYFAESINTKSGFWGWPCPTYGEYLFGRCPPKEPQIIMGEHVSRSSVGVHLVITDSVTPFAVGKFTGPAIDIFVKSEQARVDIMEKYRREVANFYDEDDLVDELIEKHGVGGFTNTPGASFDKVFDNFSGVVDLIV